MAVLIVGLSSFRPTLNVMKHESVLKLGLKRNFNQNSLKRCHCEIPNSKSKPDKILLDQPPNKIAAEYIWIDGTGEHTRSKARVLDFIPEEVSELPEWLYDGSSTYQATGENSDITLKPVAMYPDPIRGGKNKLVLCETYTPEKEPTESNHRKCCFENMKKAADDKPWFGLEQEYTFLDMNKTWPYLWPKGGHPAPQGPYYCGVGTVFGRDIVEEHFKACLACGLTVSGINAEVMPSQWEFQIGPVEGIAAPDQLWIARYLLCRIAEEKSVVSYDPKPMTGDWNGAGGHCNFSTEKMRRENGMLEIKKAIEKLEKRHKEHISVYDPKGGKDNIRRLSGKHETSSIHLFSWGIANRGVSVRVTREVAENCKGHLEDRRPSANADPYQVCSALVCTICLSD